VLPGVSRGHVTKIYSQNQTQAGFQWLKAVILAAQEAEIRRISDQNYPRQIVCEILSQKTYHKKGLVGMVAQACNPTP
jgi:hypothetical protein